MTSRRFHTTGGEVFHRPPELRYSKCLHGRAELVRASSIQPPTHESRTETPGVLKRLGLGGHIEEDEREFDVMLPPRKRMSQCLEWKSSADFPCRHAEGAR